MKKRSIKNIDKFFNPSSIAIIGASNNKEKIGYILMKKLENFKGKVYPINLNKEKILNKKAYSSINKIKEKIDLVIIATPAKTVEKILEQCGKKDIKNVIIISAGFSEIGNKKGEEALQKISEKYEINLLGPNCFGIVNSYSNLDTTFAKTTPKKGKIAFISQSGALWSYASDLKVKYSKFVSLGNMSDLTFKDFIEYFNKDKKTKKIILYIEKLKQGRRFIEVCKNSKKQIIAIKAGKSKEASNAAISHTGSIATDFKIYKGAFKQAKIKESKTLYSAITNKKAEKISYSENFKNKILIITNAGGAGALITDLYKEKNYDLVKIPKKIASSNPIDLLGTATSKEYKKIFNKIKDKNFYDKVVVIITPQSMTDCENIAKEIIEFSKFTLVEVCFLGQNSIKKAMKLLKQNKIKVLTRCC